ncbi:MAG: HlyD family type I secretion periplasmic adaptor subunit [Rhizobiaceae bacterium]|nr:HlyD family type I secretion periplasmic adaptor subunit [Rhizobiaceae bacterium]
MATRKTTAASRSRQANGTAPGTGGAPGTAPGAYRMRGRMLAGAALGLLLIGGAGGWAATAQLSGAVIAQGVVAVDQNLKTIQHRDGGIVSTIAVREGDEVREGDVLIRLEDAQTRAELAILNTQIGELAVRRARLIAERDGQGAIILDAAIDQSEAAVAALVKGETRLFAGNRAHRESQKQQLELSVAQIGEEITGLKSQQLAKGDELVLVEDEYAKIKGLADKGLVEGSRASAGARDRARLRGESGEIDAAIARAKARISEIRLQVIAIDENARTEAQRELSLVETRLAELKERQTAADDRLARTDIKAPIAGTINELNVTTIGGVITPAEILATIVPQDARLKIEAKIAPAAIDQVAAGQTARLRFSAFNQRTTPELTARVQQISPATTRDPATGDIYYLADIELDPGELAKLDGKHLIPGMPVETFVETQPRTALSYLAKPITDQFQRALKER